MPSRTFVLLHGCDQSMGTEKFAHSRPAVAFSDEQSVQWIVDGTQCWVVGAGRAKLVARRERTGRVR